MRYEQEVLEERTKYVRTLLAEVMKEKDSDQKSAGKR